MLPATQTLFYEDLALGMTETYAKEVKSSGRGGFAEISGDRNPSISPNISRPKRPSAGALPTALYREPDLGGDRNQAPRPRRHLSVANPELQGPGQDRRRGGGERRGGGVVDKGKRVKLVCRCKVGETLVLEGEAMVKVPGKAG